MAQLACTWAQLACTGAKPAGTHSICIKDTSAKVIIIWNDLLPPSEGGRGAGISACADLTISCNVVGSILHLLGKNTDSATVYRLLVDGCGGDTTPCTVNWCKKSGVPD